MTTGESITRAAKFLDYVDRVGRGEIVSRGDMQERMGVAYSTALYHLERAVSEGYLHKQHGFIDRQPGWLYALPETMPKLGL